MVPLACPVQACPGGIIGERERERSFINQDTNLLANLTLHVSDDLLLEIITDVTC